MTAFCGAPIVASDFSLSAAVGQASTQAPQETHSEARKGWCSLADTREPKPRPSIVSARVLCVSSQARTQREQTMHRSGLKSKYGLLTSGAMPRWDLPGAQRDCVTPVTSAASCSSQCPFAGQSSQSSG